MTRNSTIIDEFHGRGKRDTEETFQLSQCKDGKYCIKRENITLLIYSDEERAREGFNILRERRQI